MDKQRNSQLHSDLSKDVINNIDKLFIIIKNIIIPLIYTNYFCRIKIDKYFKKLISGLFNSILYFLYLS